MTEQATLSEKLQTQQTAQKVARATPTVLATLQDKDKSFRAQLSRALPRGMDSDRYLRALLTEVRQTPALLTCTYESFMSCVMDMAQLGLMPGLLGHVYLIPFKNNQKGIVEATLILGYRGMIHLARKSGEITSLTAEVVRANDEFRFQLGTEKGIWHRPVLDDPGVPIAFYAIAEYLNGGKDFKVLSKTQVDSYRARSRAKEGPWNTDYDAMGMKTAIRRLSPWLPLTAEAAAAITADEQRELGITRDAIEGVVPEEPEPIPPTTTVAAEQGQPPATVAVESTGTTSEGSTHGR